MGRRQPGWDDSNCSHGQLPFLCNPRLRRGGPITKPTRIRQTVAWRGGVIPNVFSQIETNRRRATAHNTGPEVRAPGCQNWEGRLGFKVCPEQYAEFQCLPDRVLSPLPGTAKLAGFVKSEKTQLFRKMISSSHLWYFVCLAQCLLFGGGRGMCCLFAVAVGQNRSAGCGKPKRSVSGRYAQRKRRASPVRNDIFSGDKLIVQSVRTRSQQSQIGL